MQIQLLHRVTRTTVTEMAHSAVERGESFDQANVFDPGTPNYCAFELDYSAHLLMLGEVA